LRAKEICESENEVAALSLSFLLVQALRFSFSGVLPNPEGLEEPQHTHSVACTLGLAGAGVCFAAFVVIFTFATRRHEERTLGRRILSTLMTVSAMALAWCLLFAAKWQLRRIIHEWDPNSMMARVLLALVVSAGAFALILVLDKIEDLDFTEEDADRALVSIINAMGILVGCSWEQSFEGAVATLASLTLYPSSMQLCLACAVALVVVPAWRRYIITKCEKAKYDYQRHDGKRRSRTLKTCEIADLEKACKSLPQLPESKSSIGLPSRGASSRELTLYAKAACESPSVRPVLV
jgi:uncharacterized membrane protein YidH (DUF202 family)